MYIYICTRAYRRLSLSTYDIHIELSYAEIAAMSVGRDIE